MKLARLHVFAGLAICGALAAAAALAARPSEKSLEEARAMIGEGRLEEARRVLEPIVEGDGKAADRAAALDLLAVASVAEGDFAGARGAWQRLVASHPESEAAWRARTDLALLDAWLGAPAGREESVTPPPRLESAAAVEAPVPAPAAAVPRSTPRPPVSAPPAAPAPPSRMLLAGDGTPPEVIEEVLARFAEHLRSSGVEVEIPATSIWWRRTLAMAQPLLLEASAGGAVLWLEFRFGHRESIHATCVGGDGREVWSEKVTGGSGYTDHRPHDTYNQELIDRLKARLDEHAGDLCHTAG
jgi:hypothetical protein